MSVAVLGVGVLCPCSLLVPGLANGGVEAGDVFPEEGGDSLAHKDGRHVGDAVPGAQPCLLLWTFAVAALVCDIGRVGGDGEIRGEIEIEVGVGGVVGVARLVAMVMLRIGV